MIISQGIFFIIAIGGDICKEINGFWMRLPTPKVRESEIHNVTGCSIDEISKVLQRGCYMLDYEGDSQGKLVALHIDLVEPLDKPKYHSS